MSDSLASKLNTLPLVIAGPLLRRVTYTTVTVWVALRQEASTLLTVYDDKGKVVAVSDPTSTTPVGKNLHLLAVTVTSDTQLAPKIVYTYDLSFTVGSATVRLAAATNNAPLVYAPLSRPSFALPPDQLNDLRIIHGSCRKPNGESLDALPMLDDLIAVTASDPVKRPHLLLLTGDQIYADEVADALLNAIIDASHVLLGWDEIITLDVAAPVGGATLPPGSARSTLIQQSGFTTDDTRAHLMALGEFLVMYLFAWSDVLWPFVDLSANGVQEKAVTAFRDTIPKVRHALANIPSYMILDDHEVTDDFNMTRNFCERVYGTKMGQRVVMNGLVAYSLCQAWGNTPEAFASGQPGATLLGKVAHTDAAHYDTDAQQIAWLVGVHSADELDRQAEFGVYHDLQSINYNYTVEANAFQIIVTDSRTWRSHPRGGDEPPDLIRQSAFGFQIDQTPKLNDPPKLNDRLLLVVVTTNMPPIASLRLASSLPDYVGIYKEDLYDSWELPSAGFDRLVYHLSSKLDQNTGRIILLSGDVHFGFASRFQFWATKRIIDQQPAKVVFAQLVASALKNEKDDTRGLHDNGYRYVPPKKSVGRLKHYAAAATVPPFIPEGYAGWNVASLTQVGKYPDGTGIYVSSDSTTAKLDPDSTYTAADFHYRLDYWEATSSGQYAAAPPALSSTSGGSTAAGRKSALDAYRVASNAYRDYAHSGGKTQQIVGHNNLGEINFHWGSGDDKTVYHTLRWQEGGNVMWARYGVTLALDDTHLTMIKGNGEP